MDVRRIISVLMVSLPVLISQKAAAQFYYWGNDPAATKWSQITTQDFQIIYPEGLDSLSKEYARKLEQAKFPVGDSFGYYPNQNYRKPQKVILHNASCVSNGMVMWIPRRMDLLTMPDSQDPIALSWTSQLAIHESRHVAQMQLSRTKALRPLQYVSGELIGAAAPVLALGISYMEGDAVLAETSLTGSGRGRNADFLEYYRASYNFDEDRPYWQWRYGSLRRFTPDHYKIGYISVAGMHAYKGVDSWKLGSGPLSVVRCFPEFADSLKAGWARNDAARGQQQSPEQLTKDRNFYTEYLSPQIVGPNVYAIRSALDMPNQLVQIMPGGEVEDIHSLSGTTSRMVASDVTGCLYWTETVRDRRWELRSWSEIKYMRSSGKVSTLTRHTRYFNLTASDDKAELCAVEYPIGGGSNLVVLDALSGKVLETIRIPGEIQAVQGFWHKGELYFSALSDASFGLYRASDMVRVLDMGSAQIKNPYSVGENIVFVSDYAGTCELYALSTENCELRQLTNLRQGGNDFVFGDKEVYFTALNPKGRNIQKLAVDSLLSRKVSSPDRWVYVLAETLSSKEMQRIDWNSPVEISDPEPYSKLANAFKVHSWLPVYLDYDNIESMSFSTLTQSAGIGATAFFQNNLGTLRGWAAYSAWNMATGWRNSLHTSIDYSGIYPVFSLSMDYNKREAGYTRMETSAQGETKFVSGSLGSPLLNLDATVYVPLNFSSCGWSRGVIPQLRYLYTNDIVDFTGAVHQQKAVASVRAYTMRNTPQSCLYPRWGVGTELGYCQLPGQTDSFRSNLYYFLYGYVPGLGNTHGMKMTYLREWGVGPGKYVSAFANLAPRGFTSSALKTELSRYAFRRKFTVDYAFPFADLDWGGLCPVAYLRNLEMVLHFDHTRYSSPRAGEFYLNSTGADLTAVLSNLLWVPYPVRIGVSCDYNGGRSFSKVADELGSGINRYYCAVLFSVEF